MPALKQHQDFVHLCFCESAAVNQRPVRLWGPRVGWRWWGGFNPHRSCSSVEPTPPCIPYQWSPHLQHPHLPPVGAFLSPTQHRCVLPVGLRAQISPHAQTVAAQCRGRAVPAPIFPHCSSSSDTELTFCSHAALGREHSIHPLPPPPPRCPSTATSGSQLIHPPLPPPLPPPPGCTPSSRGCRWAPICIQGCAAHPAAQVPSSAPYGDGWGLRMENVASAVLGTLSGSAEGGGTPRNSELSNSRWLLCDQHGRCGSGRVGSVRGGHGSLSRDPPSRDGLEAGFSPGLWGRGCTPPRLPPCCFLFMQAVC